jgi:hypothetical protein
MPGSPRVWGMLNMRCRCAGEEPAWLGALPAATVSDLASARMFCGDMGAQSRVKLEDVPVDRLAREPARLMAIGDAASPDSFCSLQGSSSMHAMLVKRMPVQVRMTVRCWCHMCNACHIHLRTGEAPRTAVFLTISYMKARERSMKARGRRP